MQNLGNPSREYIPPQNTTLTRRAVEEWERTLCENKAVALLDRLQEGRPALIEQDGGAMLIAIVLDRPLPEAQALVEQPRAFLQEVTRVLADQKTHPVLEQTRRTIQGESSKDASRSFEGPLRKASKPS